MIRNSGLLFWATLYMLVMSAVRSLLRHRLSKRYG